MRKLLRMFISLLVSAELLFGSALVGASARVELPDVPAGEYGQYVNAFVGTGGIPWMCGMLSPAEASPFGCVRLGPDTCIAGGFSKI